VVVACVTLQEFLVTLQTLLVSYFKTFDPQNCRSSSEKPLCVP